MEQSAAKRFEAQPQTPQTKVERSPKVRKAKQPNKTPYFKAERNAFIGLGVLVMAMACLVIWSNTTVTSVQAKIQTINQKVSVLQTSNANMKEEISELSSRSRLMKIAKKVGLTMNDQNIRNVTK